MTTQLETPIRGGDLLNRLILDFNTTEEIGRVKQLWLDLATHQAIGLTCKSGFLGRHQRSFTWEQIETIGTDSILVKTEEGVDPEKPESWESVIGHEVWTDAGNKAGILSDYTLDPKTGTVIDYLFVSNGWRGITDGTYQFPRSAIIRMGSKRVIATDAIVQNAKQYAEGLGQKIVQAKELLKEDYAKTQQDLATAMEGTQSFAGQLQEKTQQVTGQAKEKLSEVASQLQETAQQVSTQAQEKYSEFRTQQPETDSSSAIAPESESEKIETEIAPESESEQTP
ncbi:PRC-barrel domain-containing protein [Lusitaniella coriacea]|uniref:PRC-barrel domain-containing protein n=1 Tax=Lusitaniella coriacea TaxID=1983105 RepID=UPI003CF4B01D